MSEKGAVNLQPPFWGIGKNVQNGQTEPKPWALGNPKLYVGTARGEVCFIAKRHI